MANEVLACFGVNIENLGKEFSVVCGVNCEEPLIKFDEGTIQRLFKLKSDGSLAKYDGLTANHQYSIVFSGCNIQINSSLHILTEPIIDLQVYQSTLYVLYKGFLVIYKLPDFEEYIRYATDDTSSSILVRNFGDLVYIKSSNQILRIESLNFTKIIKTLDEILAIDSIFDSDSLICISCSKPPTIKIFDFQTSQLLLEYPSEYQINSIFSVNENVLFLYSEERNLLASFNLKKKQITYTVVFNSKVQKQVKFCEETEQLIILNKNSGKLLVFSLDEEGRITKSVVFGLNTPIEKFFHLILENELPDQAIYAGNCMHKFWMFTKQSIEVVHIEVINTKTLNFRYGEEYTGLVVKDDYEVIPEKLKIPEPPIENFEVIDNKVSINMAEAIENCIKAELSTDKVNALVSQIAFKLDELLPSVIQNSFSQAYPSIFKGISDAISSSLPSIENSLKLGLNEFKVLQDQITQVLRELVPVEKPQTVALSKPFGQLVKEKRLEEIQVLIKNKKAEDLVSALNMEEKFALGHILFDLSMSGVEGLSSVLELVCKEVSSESESFTEFYIKVSNTSLQQLRGSQMILESKF